MPGLFVKFPKRSLTDVECQKLCRKWDAVYPMLTRVRVRGKIGKTTGSCKTRDFIPFVPVNGFYYPMNEVEINPPPLNLPCQECVKGMVEVWGKGLQTCEACGGSGVQPE